jgi:hypothetical protein
MQNIRQPTDWLGVQLRSAHSFAGVIGLPLNAFVTVAPFRGGDWDGAPDSGWRVRSIPKLGRRLGQAARRNFIYVRWRCPREAGWDGRSFARAAAFAQKGAHR